MANKTDLLMIETGKRVMRHASAVLHWALGLLTEKQPQNRLLCALLTVVVRWMASVHTIAFQVAFEAQARQIHFLQQSSKGLRHE